MAQTSMQKLEHIGPAEKKRVASVPQNQQLARTSELSLPKRTESSVQITRSRSGRESRLTRVTLGERERGISKEGWTKIRRDNKER